jgi:hypothetical protein
MYIFCTYIYMYIHIYIYVGVAHTAPQSLMLIGELESLLKNFVAWFYRNQPAVRLISVKPG